jgi:hypothetical protein
LDDLSAWGASLQHMVFAALGILSSSKGSVPITAREAQHLQMGSENASTTLIWTVYGSPDKFVARPCYTLGGIMPIPVHLEAPTLEQLRALLPKGLTRTDRLPDDDPHVIETWQ